MTACRGRRGRRGAEALGPGASNRPTFPPPDNTRVILDDEARPRAVAAARSLRVRAAPQLARRRPQRATSLRPRRAMVLVFDRRSTAGVVEHFAAPGGRWRGYASSAPRESGCRRRRSGPGRTRWRPNDRWPTRSADGPGRGCAHNGRAPRAPGGPPPRDYLRCARPVRARPGRRQRRENPGSRPGAASAPSHTKCVPPRDRQAAAVLDEPVSASAHRLYLPRHGRNRPYAATPSSGRRGPSLSTSSTICADGRARLFVQCAGRDSNPHALAGPGSLGPCVYQFHHLRGGQCLSRKECPGRDSNPHALVGPAISGPVVCQFQHLRGPK